MWSEALLQMDENTLKYQVERMQAENEKLREQSKADKSRIANWNVYFKKLKTNDLFAPTADKAVGAILSFFIFPFILDLHIPSSHGFLQLPESFWFLIRYFFYSLEDFFPYVTVQKGLIF